MAAVETVEPATSGKSAALKESMRALLKKKTGGQQAPPEAAPSSLQQPRGAGYPTSNASAAPHAEGQDRGEALREALRSAPASGAAGRGEALKSSMRKLLSAKSAGKVDDNPSAVFDAVFDTHSATAPQAAEARTASPVEADEDEEDPWPEVRLSPTVLGIEDGQRRAEELTRRGEFDRAFQMWAKVRFTARRCRQPLSDSVLAEIQVAWAAAKENVPPPAPPVPIPEPVVEPVKMAASRAPAATPSKPSTRLPIQSQNEPARPTQAAVSSDARYDPNDWNHQFYAKMEKDYDNICEEDGWDAIRARQQELDNVLSWRSQDAIPEDSDYFRVQLPAGSERELRRDPAIRYPTENIPVVPKRPRRDLAELRRVEAETQAAIEKEKARRAAEVARLAPHGTAVEDDDRPSIRTKSDTVRIDSLSDESDGEKDLWTAYGSKEKEAEEAENAAATFRALEEFDKLGREKEERLAKWRERWG